MSTIEELEAQLAAARAEQKLLADLEAAREAFRADPENPDLKDAAKAAAVALREQRQAAREAREAAATVQADPVAGQAEALAPSAGRED